HGFTPFSSNHLRMEATAPLSVSGEGCGRWNTLLSPNRRTPIREPSRSLSSAPRLINSDSMSFHLMLPLVGRANICSSVCRCLRFTLVWYYKLVLCQDLHGLPLDTHICKL